MIEELQLRSDIFVTIQPPLSLIQIILYASVDLSPSLLGRGKKTYMKQPIVCVVQISWTGRGICCCDGSVMRNIMTEIDL